MFNELKPIRRLGKGTIGAVILAEENLLQQKLAVKLIYSYLAQHSKFRQQFIQSVQDIARLNHSNIASILSLSDEDEANLYLMMDYYEDSCLREYIGADSVGLYEKVDLISDLASALSVTHQQGIIHLNIKPENILIEKFYGSGSFVLNGFLTDFGFPASQAVGLKVESTWAYQPPEAFKKNLQPHPSYDIYSLGIVLFELLYDKVPFHAETTQEAALYHARKPLPKLENLRADVPEALQDVVRQCLQKNPSDRYQSAEALQNDLARVLERYGQNAPAPVKAIDLGTKAIDEDSWIHESAKTDVLVVKLYNQMIMEWPITKAVIQIGRTSESDIVLGNANVSRQHAELKQDEQGKYYLLDLNSKNGIRFKGSYIEAQTPVEWEVGVPVFIWHYELLITPVWVSEETRSMQALSDSMLQQVVQAPAQDAIFALNFLSSSSMRVTPGKVVELKAELVVHHDVEGYFKFDIEGISQDWYSIIDDTNNTSLEDYFYLKEKSEPKQLTIRIHPPQETYVAANRSPLSIHVYSHEEGKIVLTSYAELQIEKLYRFTTQLQANYFSGWEAETKLGIENQGNTNEVFAVRAKSKFRDLNFLIRPKEVNLAPGQQAIVQIKIRHDLLWYRTWFVMPDTRRFEITVQSKKTKRIQRNLASINSPQYISPLAIVAGVLLGMLSLCTLVTLLSMIF